MKVRGYLNQRFAEPEPPIPAGIKDAIERSRTQGPPRLATVKTAPTREDFDAWRDHHVTQFVFAAYRNLQRDCEASWLSQSWEGGTADQRTLDGLRERADAYADLENSDYDAFCEAAGVEPNDG